MQKPTHDSLLPCRLHEMISMFHNTISYHPNHLSHHVSIPNTSNTNHIANPKKALINTQSANQVTVSHHLQLLAPFSPCQKQQGNRPSWRITSNQQRIWLPRCRKFEVQGLRPHRVEIHGGGMRNERKEKCKKLEKWKLKVVISKFISNIHIISECFLISNCFGRVTHLWKAPGSSMACAELYHSMGWIPLCQMLGKVFE